MSHFVGRQSTALDGLIILQELSAVIRAGGFLVFQDELPRLPKLLRRLELGFRCVLAQQPAGYRQGEQLVG